MIMKLGMVNTLEYCICCNMTKQCLKERIPQHKALHPAQLAYTSTTLQHSKKPKQKTIIMKLGMKNALEHCICCTCNMTKQCLKEGIPRHKASHPTGIYLNNSTPQQNSQNRKYV